MFTSALFACHHLVLCQINKTVSRLDGAKVLHYFCISYYFLWIMLFPYIPDIFGKEGKYSVIMKKVPLPIVEFNRCHRELQLTRLGNKFKLDSSFICAGGIQGTDTCQGDGGAPLVCPIGRPADNRYAQNGIHRGLFYY